MNNIIKCPKCDAKPNGCSYCDNIGYIMSEGGVNFTISLDSKNNPVKGRRITEGSSSSGGSASGFLFSQTEPHDLIWFMKQKEN